MPAPYTDTEQDDLIDELIARVLTLETTLAVIEPQVADLLARVGVLENDNETHAANIQALQADVVAAQGDIGNLQSSVADLTTRVDAIEGVSVPAIDTVQDDVSSLKVAQRKRQENDVDQLGKPQIVTRPSLEKVRRPDGRMVQRVTRPR